VQRRESRTRVLWVIERLRNFLHRYGEKGSFGRLTEGVSKEEDRKERSPKSARWTKGGSVQKEIQGGTWGWGGEQGTRRGGGGRGHLKVALGGRKMCKKGKLIMVVGLREGQLTIPSVSDLA